ncbi:hypothetical protein [Photobacterium minamisatsumaniensis]|uniref:hypothetical protein n=1 Tax=Photobacterium minamisatsumaniensis TaxID=2910233 RepID=UPI003D117A90
MITSNAFNFSDFLDTGVDPRTGTYSASINTITLTGNDLLGPIFSGALTYSSFNTFDSGFGVGWSMPIGRFRSATSELTLCDGSNFKIRWNSSLGRYEMPYHKIKNIQVHYKNTSGTKSGEIFVYHSSGDTEVYDYSSGLLVRKISPIGRVLTFSYYSRYNEQTLYRVSDENGLFINIDTWSDKWITSVQLWDDSNLVSEVKLYLAQEGHGKALKYACIPNDTSKYTTFNYKYIGSMSVMLIESCVYPSGLEERVRYRDYGFSTPSGTPMEYVPYVTELQRFLGADQPTVVHNYEYSQKNYLGAFGTRAYKAGEDTLFKENKDYRYECTEFIGNKRIERTYNKYHLVTSEVAYTDGSPYQETEYDYYCDESRDISQQVPQYSFLKTKRVKLHNRSGETRTMDESFSFDEWGNQLEFTGLDNTKEIREYFHENGDGAIEPSPFGFRNKLKKQSIVPNGGDIDVTNTKHYEYEMIEGLSEHKVCLLKKETFSNVTIDYEHYTDRSDKIRFGRKKIEREALNGNEVVYDSQYTRDSSCFKIHRTNRYSDGTEVNKYEEFDLINQKVISTSVNDTIQMKVAWGSDNNIKEEVLELRGIAVSATQYEQHVGAEENKVIEIKPDGIKLITELNNEGAERRQYAEINSEQFILSETTYNNVGEKDSYTAYDYLPDRQLKMTTTYDYDEWGEVSKIVHPTGMVENFDYDPVTLSKSKWIDGLNRTTQRFDEADRLVSESHSDANGRHLYTTENSYNVQGLLSNATTSLGAKIEYEYDGLERVIERRIHADGETVTERFAYDSRSSESLVTTIHVNDVLIAEKEYNDLGRVTRKRYNGCEYSYQDFDVNGNPQTIILPNGATRNLTYDEVTEQVLSDYIDGDPKSTAYYTYNQSGELKSCHNVNSDIEYDRDSAGNLARVTSSVMSKSPLSMSFSNSIVGTLFNISDFAGANIELKHDDFGRVIKTIMTVGSETFTGSTEYDAYSRPVFYRFIGNENDVELVVTYNDIGLESKRQWAVNGLETLSIATHYDDTLRVSTRISNNGNKQTEETFIYDQLGRVIHYKVEGNTYPLDPHENEIKEQLFNYDEFNNITKCETIFENDEHNIELYTYDATNPMRIMSIYNSHSAYLNQHFEYDEFGNQTLGSNGIKYSYSGNNQVEKILTPENKLIKEYRYNALGEQIFALNGIDSSEMFNHDGELVALRAGSNLMSLRSIDTGASITALNANGKVNFDIKYKTVSSDHVGSVSSSADHKVFTPFG